MQPFSKETLERAHKLVLQSIDLDYPESMSILNKLAGYTSLYYLCKETTDIKEISALVESAEAINAAGITDDATAHQYMDKVELAIKKWEPIKKRIDDFAEEAKDGFFSTLN